MEPAVLLMCSHVVLQIYMCVYVLFKKIMVAQWCNSGLQILNLTFDFHRIVFLILNSVCEWGEPEYKAIIIANNL